MPVLGFALKLLAAGAGHAVEAGAAIVLGGAPLGCDPLQLFEPQQRWIEGALVELQRAVGDLQQALGDPVLEEAVRRMPSEYYRLVGPWMLETMRVRRERLPELAQRYYGTMAREAEVWGTNRPEVADILRQADALRPHIGKWVALGAPAEILVAADSPEAVLAWLARHGVTAQGGMFRVPESPGGSEGVAPA